MVQKPFCGTLSYIFQVLWHQWVGGGKGRVGAIAGIFCDPGNLGIFSSTLPYISNSFGQPCAHLARLWPEAASTLAHTSSQPFPHPCAPLPYPPDSRKFSEIVAEAKASGYTEPDPRDDLAGMDVARKVTILARWVWCERWFVIKGVCVWCVWWWWCVCVHGGGGEGNAHHIFPASPLPLGRRECGLDIELDDVPVQSLVPEPSPPYTFSTPPAGSAVWTSSWTSCPCSRQPPCCISLLQGPKMLPNCPLCTQGVRAGHRAGRRARAVAGAGAAAGREERGRVHEAAARV